MRQAVECKPQMTQIGADGMPLVANDQRTLRIACGIICAICDICGRYLQCSNYYPQMTQMEYLQQ